MPVTEIAVTIVSATLFLLAFGLLRVEQTARRAIGTTTGAMAAIRTPEMDDLERERMVQRAAIELIKTTVSLVLRSAAALAISGLPILGAHAAGLAPWQSSLAFMERWEVILSAGLIILFGHFIAARLWRR